MAVKYLCGEDALGKLTNPEEKSKQKAEGEEKREKREEERTNSKVTGKSELNR